MKLIELGAVSIRFGHLTLLKDLSFSLSDGEKLAVVGPSGAGKTTLLRTLIGDGPTVNGDVKVLGFDVFSLSGKRLRQLRSRIGQVSQSFDLVLEADALENVLHGCLPSLRFPRLGSWTYPAALRRRAQGLLDSYNLGSKEHQRVSLLSGGEKQRVAICRALMQQPSIILADEPVSALDPANANLILDDLTKVSDTGVGIVASLHQPQLALDWADTVLALRPGGAHLLKPAAHVTAAQIIEFTETKNE